MRIAVTFENGNIYPHFGHTETFKFYDTENEEITNFSLAKPNGEGHGALASFLSQNQVDVLICGGIGAGAKNALENAGIKLYGGVSGSADRAVIAFLAGKLQFNPDIKCSHHHDGDHHCGENKHGCSGND